MKRKLPLLKKDSDSLFLIVFMGRHGCERAQSLHGWVPNVTYLPSGESPSLYEWPVYGCQIYLLDTSVSQESFVKYTVLYLIGHGATSVRYFSKNTITDFYKKDLNHG